jgi:hypothetical protein
VGCKSASHESQERTQNGGVAAGQDSTTSGSRDSSAAATSAAAQPSSASASDGQVTAATLTLEDLETYEHGLQEQITIFRQASARLPQAHSGIDTLSAMAAMMPDSVASAAAHALGVPLPHYRQVESVVDGLLAARQDTKLSGQVAAKIDTANLPPEVKAQVRAGLAQTQQETQAADSAARAGLAPSVATALEQRRPKLDSLRIAYATQLGHMGR